MSTSKSAQNALRHGIYSHELVLPWEDKSELEALHAVLRHEWKPEGASEDELVLDMVMQRWNKRRLQKMAYAAFRENQVGVRPRIPDADKSLVYEAEKKAATTADGLGMTNPELREFAEILNESLRLTIKEQEKNPIINKENIAALKERLNQNKLYLAQSSGWEQKRDERTVVTEKMLKLEAMLDARFEKTIAHLVRIKEYKKFTQPKLIEAASDGDAD